jgi:hypothetical protein
MKGWGGGGGYRRLEAKKYPMENFTTFLNPVYKGGDNSSSKLKCSLVKKILNVVIVSFLSI